MASAVITERPESGAVNVGPNPTAELVYNVLGSDVFADVYAAVRDGTATTFDVTGEGVLFIPRQNIQCERNPTSSEDAPVWYATVYYGGVSQGDVVEDFEIGGGTERAYNSVDHIRYPTNAYDDASLIGVSSNGVEGVDLYRPSFSFVLRRTATTFTDAEKVATYGLVGKVNDYLFNGFAAGEVLFIGMTGGRRSLGNYELTYRFAVSPNQTEVEVRSPDGTVFQTVPKGGWEYLEVRTKDAVSGAYKVRAPSSVFVHQVYPPGNFDDLGLGV